MSLYLWLLILSILVPLALSFDTKVAFWKHWPALLPSLLITALLFIPFDIYFAKLMIWGFNPRYHSGIILMHLPLEEWLFFIVIPYASIFIHYVLIAYFPDKNITVPATRIITIILITLILIVIALNHDRIYSLTYFSLFISVLLISVLWQKGILGRFYFSFIVILLPFMIVNGILTGSFIEEEVVWYNTNEITGLRIFTIPIEDFAYGFSLIMINLLLMNYIQDRLLKKRHA